MKQIFTLALAAAATLTLGVFGAPQAKADDTTYRIAWSHYTGWEPIGYMQESGILAKHAKANGVNVEAVFVGDYVDSITLYSNGQFNGVAVTNMDVLAIAGVGGRHSTAVIVGDYSNGNDGFVLKGMDLDQVRGATVNLVEYSVSHYLLARCLDQKGMSIDDVRLMNSADADIPAIVKSQPRVAAVSWNPMLMGIAQQDGVNVVCTSKDIPGEIIDMVVMGDEVPAAARRAFADAWYEVMAKIQAGDEKVLAALAEQAGSSVADFQAQLKTTHMFYTPADAVGFVSDTATLRNTMHSVINFSFNNGVYDGVSSPTELGIRFADGAVLGDANNVALTFDVTYKRAAQ